MIGLSLLVSAFALFGDKEGKAAVLTAETDALPVTPSTAFGMNVRCSEGQPRFQVKTVDMCSRFDQVVQIKDAAKTMEKTADSLRTEISVMCKSASKISLKKQNIPLSKGKRRHIALVLRGEAFRNNGGVGFSSSTCCPGNRFFSELCSNDSFPSFDLKAVLFGALTL